MLHIEGIRILKCNKRDCGGVSYVRVLFICYWNRDII